MFGNGCELNGKGKAAHRPQRTAKAQRCGAKRGMATVTICNAELTQRQSKEGQRNGNELRCIGGAERGLEVRWHRL